ncbi:aspartate aminotransferase family protein [Sporosalibacterium faouarense]|uniref:aspartate aminotransferase family protein n=1 Tax=Sporosalibacterium faouarense TaxID=516123 RepID=UPI00192C68F1|nr:acetylornithine/succinylornithine family transaminase [Sporosalibacterium faouarense]
MSNIFEEDKKYVLNVYRRDKLKITEGRGSYLYDEDGNKYLDMYSGIAVNNLGLSNPEVLSRIASQASKFIHLSNYFVSEPTVKLAKLLVESSFASKVFFTNSGAEANEAAIKLARKFGKELNRNKIEILTAYNSFHGRTCGSLTLTGQKKYQNDFQPLLSGVGHFIFNDIISLREKVNENTCAVFLEMIQGEGGIKEATQEFIDTLVELANKYNFLIIVDEIQTGLGRVGDLFAYEKYEFTPHIVTLAKSLGGGIPLGAMLVNEQISEVLQHGDHGSTFGGNSLACAAGEYILATVNKNGFKKEVKNKSRYIFNKVYELRGKFPKIIKEVRGRGLMIGIDVGDYAKEIKTKGIERKLLLNITNKTVVRLLPALTISFGEIDEFLSKFKLILQDINE